MPDSRTGYSGPLPGMPNFRGGGFLRIVAVVAVILLLLWSVTSIPTGNVGVLTLFGRVTGETLGEGIHLINPLKSVQKLSIQTQSVKESANVPSNEGLILALDTSLLFVSTAAKLHMSIRPSATTMPKKLSSRLCAPRFARRLRRTVPTPSIPMRVSWCSSKSRTN